MISLRGLRKQKKLSQSDLAQRLMTNRTTICKIEKSNQIPTIELLKAYSNEFHIPTDTLLQLTTEYDGYIFREAYYKSATYKEVVNSIFDSFIDRIEENNKLENSYNNNRVDDNQNIKGAFDKLEIVEFIKKKIYDKKAQLSEYEENILMNVLDLIIVNTDYKQITNLFLYLNNKEKLSEIINLFIKLTPKQIKIITEIGKEFYQYNK